MYVKWLTGYNGEKAENQQDLPLFPHCVCSSFTSAALRSSSFPTPLTNVSPPVPELYTVVFSVVVVVVYRGPRGNSYKDIYQAYLRSANGRGRTKDGRSGRGDCGWLGVPPPPRRHQGSVRGGGGAGHGSALLATGLVAWFLDRASDALRTAGRPRPADAYVPSPRLASPPVPGQSMHSVGRKESRLDYPSASPEVQCDASWNLGKTKWVDRDRRRA